MNKGILKQAEGRFAITGDVPWSSVKPLFEAMVSFNHGVGGMACQDAYFWHESGPLFASNLGEGDVTFLPDTAFLSG